MRRILFVLIMVIITIPTLSQTIWDSLEMVPKARIHNTAPSDGSYQGKFVPMTLYNPDNGRYYYYNPSVMEMSGGTVNTNLATIMLGDTIVVNSDVDTLDCSIFTSFYNGDFYPTDTIQVSTTATFTEKFIYYPDAVMPFPTCTGQWSDRILNGNFSILGTYSNTTRLNESMTAEIRIYPALTAPQQATVVAEMMNTYGITP